MPTEKPKRAPGSRGRYPNRSAAEIAAIREAYEQSSESVREIMRRFALGGNEIYALINWHGWRLRGKDSRTKKMQLGGQRPMTPAQIAASRKAENAQRERDIYGAAFDHANYLRRKEYVITVERAGIFNVDSKQLTAAELCALAERERRLEKPTAMPVASTGRRAVVPSSAGVPLKPRQDPPPKLPAGICAKCGGPRSVVSTRLCRACFTGKPPLPIAASTSGAWLCSCGRPKSEKRAPRCRACYLAIKARAAL